MWGNRGFHILAALKYGYRSPPPPPRALLVSRGSADHNKIIVHKSRNNRCNLLPWTRNSIHPLYLLICSYLADMYIADSTIFLKSSIALNKKYLSHNIAINKISGKDIKTIEHNSITIDFFPLILQWETILEDNNAIYILG